MNAIIAAAVKQARFVGDAQAPLLDAGVNQVWSNLRLPHASDGIAVAMQAAMSALRQRAKGLR